MRKTHKIEVSCPYCGRINLRVPSHKDRKFCNRECFKTWLRLPENAQARSNQLLRARGDISGPNNPKWVPRMTVPCDFCGALIERTRVQLGHRKHHFCDRKCQNSWHSQQTQGAMNSNWGGGLTKTYCANCGADVYRPSHRIAQSENHFCSLRCHGNWDAQFKVGNNAGNWRGGPDIIQCDQCGTSFQMPHAWAKRRKNHFCSNECYSLWRSEHFSGSGNPNWKGGKIEVACVTCGKIIFLSKNKINRKPKHGFFCNRECYAQWQSENLTGPAAYNWRGGPLVVQCSWCGKTFGKNRNKRTRHHFCSFRCRRRWLSKNLQGKSNPHWQGRRSSSERRYYYGWNWEAQKSRALNRDGHTCQLCGMTSIEIGQEPDVHHLEPFDHILAKYNRNIDEACVEANRLANLVSYCRTCHLIIEPRR